MQTIISRKYFINTIFYLILSMDIVASNISLLYFTFRFLSNGNSLHSFLREEWSGSKSATAGGSDRYSWKMANLWIPNTGKGSIYFGAHYDATRTWKRQNSTWNLEWPFSSLPIAFHSVSHIFVKLPGWMLSRRSSRLIFQLPRYPCSMEQPRRCKCIRNYVHKQQNLRGNQGPLGTKFI